MSQKMTFLNSAIKTQVVNETSSPFVARSDVCGELSLLIAVIK